MEAPTFPDQFNLEVKLTSMMNYVGPMGAIAAHVMACFEDKVAQLKETAEKFRDGSVAIDDPREEAAAILSSLKETLAVTWGKDMTDLARVTASLYSTMLGMRRLVHFFPSLFASFWFCRGIYLKKVGDKKQARNRLKALTPSTEYLFGGNVGDLCHAVHQSFALPPPSKKQKFATGWRDSNQGSAGGFSKSFWPHKERSKVSRGFKGGQRGGKPAAYGRGKALQNMKE